LEPDDQKIHYNLGLLYFEQGKYNEAEKAYKTGLKLKPKFAPGHDALGILYLGQKKYEEAENEFKKAFQLDPNLPANHNNLGLLYFFSGENS